MLSSSRMRAARWARPSQSLWMSRASPTISPTVIRGSREAEGSWKMICIFRR